MYCVSQEARIQAPWLNMAEMGRSRHMCCWLHLCFSCCAGPVRPGLWSNKGHCRASGSSSGARCSNMEPVKVLQDYMYLDVPTSMFMTFMPFLQPSVYTVVWLHWVSKLTWTAAHLYSALWPCRGPCFLFCMTGLALACSLSSLLPFIVFLQRPSRPFLKHDSGSTFPSTSRSFLPLLSLGESCC